MKRNTINLVAATMAAALVASGSAWGQGYDPYTPDSRDPYDTTYPHRYPHPQATLPIFGGLAPMVTGRSVATRQMGNYCTTQATTCELDRASFVGHSCSCKVPGGRVQGSVTP
ncbi:MAG: hypothetical protein ACREC4_08000 [Methylocella sp.]